MRPASWTSARRGQGLFALLVLVLTVVVMAVVEGSSSSQAAAQSEAKLEATIFSYDGKDFVRTRTTMMTADGKSAVNTKLDHDSPAYKALMQKHSYIGDATVFGRHYDADYAPLISDDGRLTGALFIGVAK
jgi:hypothetical protein